MATIINPKVAQVFAADSQQMKFVAAALEQLLGEEKTEALISEILPQEVKPSPKFKGQPLVLFNGLSRDQLKSLHGFTDSEVDEVYTLMGVTEVEVKSAATVNKEAVESAGTASERADVTTTVEGQTEAEVDAAPAPAAPVQAASVVKEPAKSTSPNQSQQKGNQAKAK